MRLMTGGDLLARTLAQEGVDHLFGIIGGQVTPLFDAMNREPTLRLVMPRNEAAGALMAAGYARASNRPAVVISTVGAGAVYAAAGVADAWGDHVPVLSISPQVQTWKMYPSQESLQGCYQADMLAGVTRWNCIAYNWKRIPRLVQRALREALSGEKGAVHMDVPVDVFFEAHFVSERKLRELIPPPGTSRFQGLVLPDEGESHRAASLIEGSRKPVIAAGSGVLREEAWDALALLAESLPAPVVLTPPALSAATGDDPRYAGIAGHPALGVVEETLQEADLVLMIGVTLDEGEKILSTVDAARTKIIQTSPQPELLGALGPVDAALAGDAASLARILAAGVKGGGESRREWTRNRRRSFEASRDALRGDAGRRGPGAAVRALGEALLPDDLLVMDGKESIYWGSVLCPAGKNNTRFISYGLRGFGYGLPTALGVKLARPRERVLALCDTDALFHHIQELETARREETAVTVCVVGEPYDWVEVAEGFGLAGARADTPAELMNALQAADTRGGTTVIDLTRFGE